MKKVYVVQPLTRLRNSTQFIGYDFDVYTNKKLALARIENSIEVNKGKNIDRQEFYSGVGFTVFYDALSTEGEYFRTAVSFSEKTVIKY